MKKIIIPISLALALAISLASFATSAYAMNRAELIEAIASDAGLTVSVSGTSSGNAQTAKGLNAVNVKLAQAVDSFFDVFIELSLDRAAIDSFFDIFTRLDPEAADSFFDVFTELSAQNTRTKRVKYSNIVLKRGSVFSPNNEGDTSQINKARLIEVIASDANLTKADARRALDAFIDVTTNSLRGGSRVALVGFGSFSISKRKARTGRNPQTIVKFKAGDRPFLPKEEYTTTEDIVKYIAEASGDETRRGLTEDQARQFMDSFTNVIFNTLQTGIAVNVGEDFGTFWTPPIGHVDHGKGRSGATIQIPAKKVVKFKAGADLAKTVA